MALARKTKKLLHKSGESSGEAEFLWLVSLSDLMILLFIFFVVLFSFTAKKASKTDYQEMAASLRNEAPPPNPVSQMEAQFQSWVKEQNLDEQVEVKKKDDAVLIDIKDKILFGSGEIVPHEEGIKVIREFAGLLSKVPEPYRIGIEGHTDDIPIHTYLIQDNWDLSAKRALSVFYAMNLSPEISKRTILMAYGDTNPLASNRDQLGIPIAENQAKNRRVTIRIF